MQKTDMCRYVKTEKVNSLRKRLPLLVEALQGYPLPTI